MFKTRNYDGTEDAGASAPTEPPASLAKLRIDSARLLPFLAAPRGGIPSINATDARMEPGPAAEAGTGAPASAIPQDTAAKPWLDAAPRATLHDFTAPLPPWLQGSTTASANLQSSDSTSSDPATRQSLSADPLDGFPPAPSTTRGRSLVSQIAPAELSQSLASFSPEALTQSEGISGIDRVMSTSSPLLSTRSEPNGLPEPAKSSMPSPIEFSFPQSSLPESGFNAIDPASRFWMTSTGGSIETSPIGDNGPSSSLDARLARAVERLERIAEQLDQLSPMSRSGPSRPFRGRIDV